MYLSIIVNGKPDELSSTTLPSNDILKCFVLLAHCPLCFVPVCTQCTNLKELLSLLYVAWLLNERTPSK